MRSRSSKTNEPPLFIQVTSKNGERVLVFPSFLSPESRNADDALWAIRCIKYDEMY